MSYLTVMPNCLNFLKQHKELILDGLLDNILPEIVFNNVVFPAPDPPNIPSNCPLPTLPEMLCKICLPLMVTELIYMGYK